MSNRITFEMDLLRKIAAGRAMDSMNDPKTGKIILMYRITRNVYEWCLEHGYMVTSLTREANEQGRYEFGIRFRETVTDDFAALFLLKWK